MTGFNSKREAAADKLQEPDALTIAYQSGFYDGKKAALAQPPLPVQPAQEPVAYVTGMSFGRFIVEPLNPAMVLPVGMAFYTAPPKRQWIWLSDADIRETIDSICQYSGDYDEFLCKKIERKIKELNT